MLGRILTLTCIFVCALGAGTVAALDGTGIGTYQEKVTIRGCEKGLENGHVTGFSIDTPGSWSMSATGKEYAGDYTLKRRAFNLELDSSSHGSLLSSVTLVANQLCSLPPGALAITDAKIKKFSAKLTRDRATLRLKLQMKSTLTDGNATYKLTYSMLADIAFIPTGGGIGGKITGRVLAPNGQIAASKQQSLMASIADFLLSPSSASVAGLSPVPNGTPVELVYLSVAGTVDAVLATTNVSRGKYKFNLDKLGHYDAPDLAVRVSDRGVQMRAFLTASIVDISPDSEAVFQLVIDRIMAVPGTLLSYFTFDELDDLAASVDLLTTLEALPALPGIDATVAAIKNLVEQDPELTDFLVAAASAGQTGVGPGDVGNLIPLDQGNAWEYLVTSSETPNQYYDAYSVMGTKDIDGITASILHYSNPDNSGVSYEEYREKNSLGLFNWGNSDPEDFLTPVVAPYQEEFFPIQLDATNVTMNRTGLVWAEDLDGDGGFESFDVVASITTGGVEAVTVPVGVFTNTVKQDIEILITIHLSGSNRPVKVTNTITQWLASDIGQVKIEYLIKVKVLRQTTTVAETYELSAYSINGESGGVFSHGRDMSFGNAGIVINDDAAVGLDPQANAVAIQADGNILAAGTTYNNRDVLVQRYTTEGDIDNSFAVNGSFVFDGGESDQAYAIALQPDGKVIVAGVIDQFNAGNDNVLVLRLDQDGNLDATFGINGVVATSISNKGETGYAVAITADDKILVGGSASTSTDTQALMLRYHPDGSLDDTFGNAGIYLYDGAGGGADIIRGIAMQPDGKLIATGSTSIAGSVAYTDVLVLRLGTDGSLDPAFGNGGVVVYSSGYLNNNYEKGTATVIQPDGKIVVDAIILAMRLNGDGTFDQTFGNSGIVPYQELFQDDSLYGHDVELTVDGKFIIAGINPPYATVLRINSDGSLDMTFNEDGLVEIKVPGGGGAYAYDAAIQTDGKVVVAGESNGVFLSRLVAY